MLRSLNTVTPPRLQDPKQHVKNMDIDTSKVFMRSKVSDFLACKDRDVAGLSDSWRFIEKIKEGL